ncbi:MAG: hypothetical protein PHD83_02045 [Caldisericia bacterium]|nr:hypothetical protein [Caldisericia bacterium]
MNQDYEEVPFTGFVFMYGAFILIALLFPVLAILQNKGIIKESNPGPVWFNWVMTLFFVALTVFLYQFRKLKIEYHLGIVRIQYGFLRSTIPYNEIESVYLDTSNPFLAYGGWGLRLRYYGGKFRLVYNMPSKPCVVIALKNKKREVVFATNKPDYWIERLKQPF